MEDLVVFNRRISYLGDFTWSSASGRTVRLQPSPIQSLSELERVRLQEVAYSRLHQDYDLACQITIPKDCQKRKKSLRKKFDSLAKEKSKDKEFAPQAFGMPLSQVIANDRVHKQRHDGHRTEEHRDTASDLVSSILHFTTKRPSKELSSSNSSLSSTSETPSESVAPGTPEAAPRARRRGGMSVDCITDLDDNESRLLEALQLSLPAQTPSRKEKHRDKKLSLNPIYRQVPRVLDCCCQHLEKYGLQTVGIFRVGSSKKRVRQLRDEFDQGSEVQPDEEHSVHDVAALLKEFLRDMPDPLLTKELYTAFINCMSLDPAERCSSMQLLVYLLPPCNSDTLHRLLEFLSTVADHAEDTHHGDGQEIPGNKMTSLNLATIFGPNLLHKQKSSDKEFMVQSSARAEESTTIIGIVQRMIDAYESLFTVSADLQHEVLMSLLETDPDVVDYLLRRKASQWENPDLLRSDDSFSLNESDSNNASSGEVSPYENNSPVFPERLLSPDLCEDGTLHRPDKLSLEGRVRGRPGHTGLPAASSTAEDKDEQTHVWEAWHASMRAGLKNHSSGSHGDVSQCSLSSAEGLDSQRGLQKLPVRRTQTSAGVEECRTHTPVTRASSSPQTGIWLCQPQHSTEPRSQPGSSSLDDIAPGRGSSARPPLSAKPGGRQCGNLPPPYPGLHRGAATLPPSTTTTTPYPQGSQPMQALRRPPQREASDRPFPLKAHRGRGSPDWQDWQRDKWQIWQLLSSDNADALPETLV
ncbi:rho GTPase-activating protein 6-like isoform X2 [Clupea harengus]|uniref:Rho GTPase-activating protein 6-like isoform X2 n=1 Tax=Clupea harengus TaxID=7950 RepID=A0A6P8EK90_CLUHA|nr:rho GTPase-activating protein 6-like isoform X2 [Clupea harengus]